MQKTSKYLTKVEFEQKRRIAIELDNDYLLSSLYNAMQRKDTLDIKRIKEELRINQEQVSKNL